MERKEYERRKRILEGQRSEALALIQAGFDAQLRALDMVWMASPGSGPLVSLPVEVPQPLLLAGSLPAPAEPSQSPAPAKRVWGPAELYNLVFDLLPQLPDEFDRDDVMAALPERPKRSSLYKVLEELHYAGEIERVQSGRGQIPSTYRRKGAGPSRMAEG